MVRKSTEQMSLRDKLIAVNLYKATIPMIVMAFIMMSILTVFASIQRSNHSLDVINSIEVSTLRYLSRYDSSLDEVYYALYQPDKAKEEVTSALIGYVNSNKEISTVWLLDPNGKIIFGAPNHQTELGFDYSGQDYYKALERVGDIYWSDVYITHGANKPVVTVSKKFQDAIVVLRIDLESLSKFLKVFDISKNSFIAVTDTSSAYMAHTNYNFVNTRAYDPNRNALLLNERLYTEYDNKKVIAYHRILKNNKWSIIYYQSVIDLVLPIILIMGGGVIMIGLIGLMTLKAVMGLNNELSGEVKALVTWTNQVARGKYETQIKQGTTKEFDTLSGAFSVMIRGVLYREEALEAQRQEIIEINDSLEIEVQKRTEELERSLTYLKKTQVQLIRKEKMASLGSLVSGVAHELNTPIGVALTAASYLEKKNTRFLDRLSTEKMTSRDLRNYVEITNEITNIIVINMDRASDLISSFKKVAINQEKMNREIIYLKDIINATVTSLGAELKRKKVEVTVHYEGNLMYDSYPGAISQIVTNLIQNSIIHAFNYVKEPLIGINCTELEDKKNFVIEYWDNGKGIHQDDLDKVYDPFYTTAQGTGGTGLGMNIVYNLVTGLLMGDIEYQDELTSGVRFIITLPKEFEK